MVNTVIFDIGKVLIRFEWMNYIHSLFSDDDICDKLTYCIWNSGWWKELDRGVMPEENVLKEIEREAQYKGIKDECLIVLNNFGKCMDYQDYAIPWIQELKNKGFRVYYLSNYSQFLINANPEILNFIEYMDGGIFSFKENIMKPDERIFDRLCEKYNLRREECLFTDDVQMNVDAARKFGMKAIRFDGYEKIYPVIMHYLLEDNGKELQDLDDEGLPFDGMDWTKWNE